MAGPDLQVVGQLPEALEGGEEVAGRALHGAGHLHGALQQVGPPHIAHEQEVSREHAHRLIGAGGIGHQKGEVLRRVPRGVQGRKRIALDRESCCPRPAARAPASAASLIVPVGAAGSQQEQPAHRWGPRALAARTKSAWMCVSATQETRTFSDGRPRRTARSPDWDRRRAPRRCGRSRSGSRPGRVASRAAGKTMTEGSPARGLGRQGRRKAVALPLAGEHAEVGTLSCCPACGPAAGRRHHDHPGEDKACS